MQLDDIISIISELKFIRLIATNTTIDRSMLATNKSQVDAIGAGG